MCLQVQLTEYFFDMIDESAFCELSCPPTGIFYIFSLSDSAARLGKYERFEMIDKFSTDIDQARQISKPN